MYARHIIHPYTRVFIIIFKVIRCVKSRSFIYNVKTLLNFRFVNEPNKNIILAHAASENEIKINKSLGED